MQKEWKQRFSLLSLRVSRRVIPTHEYTLLLWVGEFNEALRLAWAHSAPTVPGLSLSLSLFLSLSVFLCFTLPSPAFAGHGFASAFGNIEWLPDPGRTPDSALYRLDAVWEASTLMLARTSTEKVQLCLTFAREKLAELEAMVKAENATAAATAAEQYQGYLDHAEQFAKTETNEKETLDEKMVNALLEHQYILSVIYPELPMPSRTIVLQVIAAAQKRYQEIAKQLSPKKKGALFFKEEEVRWSVDMATRADEVR